jgi:hypothetical protein
MTKPAIARDKMSFISTPSDLRIKPQPEAEPGFLLEPVPARLREKE